MWFGCCSVISSEDGCFLFSLVFLDDNHKEDNNDDGSDDEPHDSNLP